MHFFDYEIIQRFKTRMEAKSAARPCPINKSDPISYIVGGSVIDPTYYLVQTTSDAEAITGSTAGTSVYRRVCATATNPVVNVTNSVIDPSSILSFDP